MRSAAVLLVLVTPAAASVDTSAPRHRERPCEVLEYGEWVPTASSTRVPDPGSYDGQHFEIAGVTFTRHARQIPGKLGLRFGMRYLFHDLGASAQITWRITYPQPIKGFGKWEYTFTDTPTSGELTGYLGHHFEEPWEIVRGTWKVEAFADGRAACKMLFQVD